MDIRLSTANLLLIFVLNHKIIPQKHLELDLMVLVCKEVVEGFIEYFRKFTVGASFIAKLAKASNTLIIVNVDLYSDLISKYLQSFIELLHYFIASFAFLLILTFISCFFRVLEDTLLNLNEVLFFNELGLLDYLLVITEISLDYLEPESS